MSSSNSTNNVEHLSEWPSNMLFSVMSQSLLISASSSAAGGQGPLLVSAQWLGDPPLTCSCGLLHVDQIALTKVYPKQIQSFRTWGEIKKGGGEGGEGDGERGEREGGREGCRQEWREEGRKRGREEAREGRIVFIFLYIWETKKMIFIGRLLRAIMTF